MLLVWMYDAFVSEKPLATDQYEVRSADAERLRDDNSTYRVTVKLKNLTDAGRIEEAQVQLTLLDCIPECRIIGRQTQEFYFLADPGEVREDARYYNFTNIVKAKGDVRTQVDVLEATGDF